ncbi:hypothetical protein MPNT_110044 [Candidatus Methylacidithermus pantelleriae]|uniref:Uncharacterized protein n=1 Tax=Candidatus Methylacidithermus pantelleriae TaxID=2744239 RepID=A0A8J2BL38_9BACT|nr:hypothetical protein MPNT_110044 [Candidatus Methylacidithermus pantelleriae]
MCPLLLGGGHRVSAGVTQEQIQRPFLFQVKGLLRGGEKEKGRELARWVCLYAPQRLGGFRPNKMVSFLESYSFHRTSFSSGPSDLG